MDIDVLKFIGSVRQRECLYNRKCADYGQRFVVLESWRSVAREMNLLVMDCKEKWHNLRSNYMRERKKVIRPGIKKWHLLDALSFLEPHHCAKKKKRIQQQPDVTDPKCIIDDFESFTPQNVTSSEQFGVTRDVHPFKKNIPDETIHQSAVPANPSPIEILDNSESYQMEQNDNMNVVSDHDEQDDSTYTLNPRGNKLSRKRRMVKNRKSRHRRLDYEYLKQVRKLSRHLTQSDEDSDRMFLLSLLPLVKKLSSKDNIDFRVEVQRVLQQKLNP